MSVSAVNHDMGRYIRILNYHNTPFSRSQDFERQVRYLNRYFLPVGLPELEDFFKKGNWEYEKPGLIFAFYNGYRNNYDVIYPILQKYGFIGWFFVATEFIGIEPGKQLAFGNSHTFNIIGREYDDERYAMSWEELREMSSKHVICSHTRTHSTVINASATKQDMEREILQSAKDIETNVGVKAPGFCWLGGEEAGSCPEALEYIKMAGYRFMFGNYKIERI